MIYQEKSEFWHREFLIIQTTIYGKFRNGTTRMRSDTNTLFLLWNTVLLRKDEENYNIMKSIWTEIVALQYYEKTP